MVLKNPKPLGRREREHPANQREIDSIFAIVCKRSLILGRHGLTVTWRPAAQAGTLAANTTIFPLGSKTPTSRIP